MGPTLTVHKGLSEILTVSTETWVVRSRDSVRDVGEDGEPPTTTLTRSVLVKEQFCSNSWEVPT